MGIKESVASLPPAYFAIVMATGIVSIAAHSMEMPVVAQGLFGLNIALYLSLWAITLLRAMINPRGLLADLTDHVRTFGFFTTAAGSGILGMQFLLIRNNFTIATVLWFVTVALWAILTYAIFTIVTVGYIKPTIAQGLHGGWLLSVVASQSVSILGASLATQFPCCAEQMLFASLALWLGGGMLYLWIISLVFYRYAFFPLTPAELTPPYWINVGAMAISTLAGTSLIAQIKQAPLLGQLSPFLIGGTVLCWATASWWIPLLIMLDVWRHVVKLYQVKYDPSYWSAVFPLGMYAVCTRQLTYTLKLPFLLPVANVFGYLAIIAWAVTFAGLIAAVLRGSIRR